jgi:hypothetical protein
MYWLNKNARFPKSGPNNLKKLESNLHSLVFLAIKLTQRNYQRGKLSKILSRPWSLSDCVLRFMSKKDLATIAWLCGVTISISYTLQITEDYEPVYRVMGHPSCIHNLRVLLHRYTVYIEMEFARSSSFTIYDTEILIGRYIGSILDRLSLPQKQFLKSLHTKHLEIYERKYPKEKILRKRANARG